MSTRSNPVAIIGGGLSGMSLAYELHARGIPFVLYESSDHLGGAVRTVQENDYVVEQGPNGFLNNAPATLDLFGRLGLEDQIVPASSVASTRYIARDGKLHAVPTSPPALLKSSLVPLSSKLRILTEPFRSHAISQPGESILQFFTRHFDAEVANQIVAPFVIGVYAGDANLLSVQECFPALVQIEKEHGSLIKGMLKRKKSSRTRLISLKNGVGQLLQTLAAKLPTEAIKLNQPVTEVRAQGNQFEVATSQSTTLHSAVVFSGSTSLLKKLPSGILSAELSSALQNIPVAPVRTLSISFKGSTGFCGFGALLRRPDPSSRGTSTDSPNLLGFLHPPDLFSGRVAQNEDLLTTLWGGHWTNSLLNMPVAELTQFAIKELETLLGQKLPPVQKVWDWLHVPGIPQYTVQAMPILNQLKEIPKKHPGVFIHSNILGGVSMNDCITKSVALANQITLLYKNPTNQAK